LIAQLTNMLCKDTDKYNHQDVYKRICNLRMKLDELVEEFFDWFLHLYCKILQKKLNSYLLGQQFKHLVHLSVFLLPQLLWIVRHLIL